MWTILDEQENVIGEWTGPTHWVTIFDTKQEAHLEAIALNIPNFKICTAVEGLSKKPSHFLNKK